ncbi:MAG: carboxymuconolactone decarboxylase family protein [Thermoleophilia bacterium]|nr:carboxymuconolactone decarboxylase family protein [Thermoleophilia bacterium]
MAIQQATRRERGRARLAELHDEPGGDEFLATLGDLGELTVDFVFGDVHSREGLGIRERELVIVGVLTALGGLEPQVRAHVRAARAIGVDDRELEETIVQTAPYAGFPRAINAMKILREEQHAGGGSES